MAAFIKGNNNGRGFYYTMGDGSRGWVLGKSKAEWNMFARQHGGFIEYKRA